MGEKRKIKDCLNQTSRRKALRSSHKKEAMNGRSDERQENGAEGGEITRRNGRLAARSASTF